MPDIGIVATAAYVPSSIKSAHGLPMEMPMPANSPTARLLQACFEENLLMHGISLEDIDAARSSTDMASLIAQTGFETYAEELEMEVSELLLRVANELLSAKEESPSPKVATFLVCQTSLERDITLSAACRLQAELNQGRTPFAVGQLEGASFLLGVSIAKDLMCTAEDADRIAVVAAERWCWPYLRTVADTTLFGDGAGAVLLERECEKGWMIRAIKIRTPAPSLDVFRYIALGMPFTIELDGLCTLVRETIEASGARPRDIKLLVPHCLNRSTTDAVRKRCGLQHAWSGSSDISQGGYFCAAETPVRLHRLLQLQTRRRCGQRLLLYALGFGGSLACAVLEYVDPEGAHETH